MTAEVRLARAIHKRRNAGHGEYTDRCICNDDAAAILRGASKMVPPLNVEKIIAEWEVPAVAPHDPQLTRTVEQLATALSCWGQPLTGEGDPEFVPWAAQMIRAYLPHLRPADCEICGGDHRMEEHPSSYPGRGTFIGPSDDGHV